MLVDMSKVKFKLTLKNKELLKNKEVKAWLRHVTKAIKEEIKKEPIRFV